VIRRQKRRDQQQNMANESADESTGGRREVDERSTMRGRRGEVDESKNAVDRRR